MNYSDAERISAFLENSGFKKANQMDEADLILFMTCSVRQKAEDRIFGLAGKLKKLKENNSRLKIAITGCTAKLLGSEKLKKKMPVLDLVFDINDINALEKILFLKKENKIQNFFEIFPETLNSFSAFVPIMTGCDNFCSYCVVPFARGREKSREFNDIFDECQKHVQKGKKELTLLGQNVNSYQHDFPLLLEKIADIPHLQRLRFTTSHPKDLSDRLIDVIKNKKNICKHIHLAVQHGDDQVLIAMNRKYTSSDFLKLLEKIRKKIPEISITTDLIVGFPGETEEQFQNLVSFYKEANFDLAYIAKYSPRPQTAAYKMNDNVTLEEKRRRFKILDDLQKEIGFQKNKKFIGKTASVLVENFTEKKSTGRTECARAVEFKSKENLTGQIVEISIKEAKEWVLVGESRN